MKYQRVFVESFVATFPEEVVTTGDLERRLEPLYSRLKLPEGRLELMTGIKERRLWRKNTLPGTQSIETVRSLLEQTAFDREKVGCFIHASVCRDFLEPATACRVHEANRLPEHCAVYDVSNACLGLLSGMVQIANMIELGQIEAGIVVGTECSRSLMESTIEQLNTDPNINRKNVKPAFASLTIGSGSAAVLLTNEKLSTTNNRLVGGVVRTNTSQCRLCQSDGMAPMMQTDSEKLMHEGVAVAKSAFDEFLSETGWTRESIQRTFCHQVGKAHQQLLFETLKLAPSINFATLPYLGNTGAVALPTAAAVGTQTGFVSFGERVALLGIGSGINVIMLGVEWQKSLADTKFQQIDVVKKICENNPR
ncbi:MAG: 3-oxoacyl-ACP synthase III [Planctomycetaceae bacterium]|jgi:3-oxoacyl-[acyl-carrier-protein] synthase-3|nr:3-oxoacyl-ACP synthase III [Planctomycetaceae bacterium]